MLTWFSVFWSQFQFIVIIDYFLGKMHRVFALLTQPERELLSNRYLLEPRNTCTIRQQVFNHPISPHVVHKSVEVIINTYCAGAIFTIQNPRTGNIVCHPRQSWRTFWRLFRFPLVIFLPDYWHSRDFNPNLWDHEDDRAWHFVAMSQQWPVNKYQVGK